MTEQYNDKAVDNVITLFGGIRPMSKKLNIPVTTIQGWKERGRIPQNRIDEIIEKAQEHDLSRAVSGHLGHYHSSQEASSQESAQKPVRPQQDSYRLIDKKEKEPSTATLKRRRAREDRLNHDISTSIRSFFLGTVASVGAFVILFMLFFGVEVFPTWKKGHGGGEDLPLELPQNVASRSEVEALQAEVAYLTQRNESMAQEIEKIRESGYANSFVGDESFDNRVGYLENQISSMTTTSEESLGRLTLGLQSLERDVFGENAQSLYGMVKYLGTKVDALSNQVGLDKAMNSSEVRRLANKVNAHVNLNDVKAAGLLIAMAQLRGAISRDAPFENDLVTVKEMVGNDPELVRAIEKLEPYAKDGLTSRDALNQHLNKILEQLIAKKPPTMTGQAKIENPLLRKLADIISIKKLGEARPAPDDPAKVVLAAQESLQRGDVVGAVDKMLDLGGPAAILADPFLEKAQGYLQANGLMSKLSREIAAIAKTGNPNLTRGVGAAANASMPSFDAQQTTTQSPQTQSQPAPISQQGERVKPVFQDRETWGGRRAY